MSEHHPPASPQEPRTLETRVAAIEERLAQLTVTEEEMRAYQKVAALMAGRPAAAGPTTHVSPIASTVTTGGLGPSIPLVSAPHVPFPTVPVINIALIGGFGTPLIALAVTDPHVQDAVSLWLSRSRAVSALRD